jgi:plastocyanin
MRWCLFSAVIMALIGAAAGLRYSVPTADQQAAPLVPFYAVEMRDHYFDPPGLWLQLHDQVTWVLRETGGAAGHSATAYHPSQDKELRIPESAQPFNSDVRKRLGSRFTSKFTEPGVYDYFCIPHEDLGMVGRLIIKEATGPGTKPLTQGVSVAGQSMMPTIEEILGVNGQIFSLLARLNGLLLLQEQRRAEQAAAHIKAIRDDWASGADQENSAYGALQSLGLHESFGQKLASIEDALLKKSSISIVQDLIRQAKGILYDAISRLSQR